MSKFKRVLSDDDLVDIFALGVGDLSAKPFNDLVEVLEQAIINKLKAEREPVAWLIPEGYGERVTIDAREAIYLKQELNLDIKPLYEHPAPNCQGILVNSGYIPDTVNDQDIFRLRQKEKKQREAISEWLELKDNINKSGRPPHADYWNQAIYEAENKMRLSIQY